MGGVDESHADNLSHLRGRDAIAAYLYLVRTAQDLVAYTCLPNTKGKVRAVRYYCGDKQRFGFIVNKNDLLFYFRNLAVIPVPPEDLKRYFPDVDTPRKDEITVRIKNLQDAQQLMFRVFGFSDAQGTS
jgi:hypothetical protein